MLKEWKNMPPREWASQRISLSQHEKEMCNDPIALSLQLGAIIIGGIVLLCCG